MHSCNRREFIRHGLTAGAVVAFTPKVWPAQARHANDMIEFGPQKLRVSRMAIGTGTYGGGGSSNQMRQLGADGLADVFWDAFDNGVNYWDLADGYGSHAAAKVALKKVPREKVIISTKAMARDAAGMKTSLERFRQEIGADQIDIILLHAQAAPNWPEVSKGPMDVLAEAKEKKLVRSVGISCHGLPAMQAAAKSPWLDICLVRLNNFGIRMDGDTDEVLPLVANLRAAGKGVIAMKILGEGQLRNRLDDAFRFAVTKDAAQCFTVGTESRKEFHDNFDRVVRVSQPA